MKIKIVYDNKRKNANFLSGWGFSCLIGEDILFDTGEKEASLLHNLRAFGIDLSEIKNIVISHEHWDHTGALQGILRKTSGMNVFIGPGFSMGFKSKITGFKAKVMEHGNFYQIKKSVFITKPLVTEYKNNSLCEQSIVITTEKGLSVITGCAHPGIIRILKEVKKEFPHETFYAILGGFHLKDLAENEIDDIIRELLGLGIKIVAPCHCAGDIAVMLLKKNFGENCLDVSSGAFFDL